MKKIFLVFIICLFTMFTGCMGFTTNDIYNKTYDVEINIDNIGDALVPAVEKAVESTLGVGVYVRSSLNASWTIESVGSCVVYETIAVLKDGSKISYDESKTLNNISHYEYKVVTNAHVVDVTGAFKKFTVYLGEQDRIIEAELLGMDEDIDLAVLTFTETTLIVPISISNSDEVKQGQIVLAIGNPSGYEYYSSATMGIVSFPKRYIKENGLDIEFIQHDAAINPGSSGGSLVNSKGELVGINTSKVVEDDVDSIGFAIPSNTVLKVIERLENNQALRKNVEGMISVSVSTLKNDMLFINERIPNESVYELEYGIYIHSISSKSLLYGDVRSGDVILAINDNEIRFVEELNYLLLLSEKGDKLNLSIYRNGSTFNVVSEL